MALKIDSFDRALLKLVQKDSRMTFETLGEKVGLSTPAVHRRIKRLRESGIIEKEVAILDGKKLADEMTFIVNLEVEREKIDLMESMTKELLSFPEVQQAYYVTGDTDYVIIIKANSISDYEQFTQKAFFGNSNVRKFTTCVTIKEIKVGLEIPL